jgi:undecaprenyl pyrophosphate phosphatase UppP
MPEWLAVFLLGVIEGVTEFLPISSTGHLLLVENAHLLPGQSDLFNITIQSGAALAVLAVFGGRLRDLLAHIREPEAGGYETLHALRHPAGPPTKWGMLALGTVVSAVTAFVVVRWLLRWIQTHSFVPFGWYRIALGLLMLARFV